MACSDCDRRRRYMAADPEQYRGDDTLCEAHQRLDLLGRERLRAAICWPGCMAHEALIDRILGEA